MRTVWYHKAWVNCARAWKMVWFTFLGWFTGCPKSSFLYFISLQCSTIRLHRQIVFQNLCLSIFLIFHTCCAIFWLEYLICVHSHERCACASKFPRHTFLYFLAQIANSYLVFVNITKDQPFKQKTFSYVRAEACVHWSTGLSVKEISKKNGKIRMLAGKMVIEKWKF